MFKKLMLIVLSGALLLLGLAIAWAVSCVTEYRRDNPSVQIVRLINPSVRDIAAVIHTRLISEEVVKVIVPKHGEITREFHIEGDADIWVTYPSLDSRQIITSEAYYVTNGVKTSITLRLDEGKPFLVGYD